MKYKQLLIFLFSTMFLVVSSFAMDQCNTTAECKSIYGDSATDCLNSQSNNSVCMCGNTRCDANDPPPDPTPLPSGWRIAYSADGNQHDRDDHYASVMTLSILAVSGNKHRLVHFDYNNHLGNNNGSMATKHKSNINEAISRYGYNSDVFFDDQQNLSGAVQNMANAINTSSAESPLYLVCAGPMELCWRGINAAQQDKRAFVTLITHSNWNNTHSDTSQLAHQLSHIRNQFSNVKVVKIKDQNNGDWNPLGTGVPRAQAWNWLKQEQYGDWLYSTVVGGPSGGDCSDAGMVHYILRAFEGTNRDVDMSEIKAIYADRGQSCGLYEENNGLVIMEAESTPSPLDKWVRRTRVGGYTGSGHLEFMANTSNGGPATSPLTYTFRVSNSGNYRMVMRAHKRLDGQPSDKNNDGYVRLDGDYESTGATPIEVLKNNTKMYGGAPNGWGWAEQLDQGNHNFKTPIYKLTAGRDYRFVLSGRSIKFNVDRIIFFNTDQYSLDQAKTKQDVAETCESSSPFDFSSNQIIPAKPIVTIPASTQQTFTVNYSADNNRNLYVIVFDKDWGWISTAMEPVTAGTGTHTFDLTLPHELVTGETYHIKFENRPEGADWQDGNIVTAGPVTVKAE